MKKIKDIVKIAAFDVDGTLLPNGHMRFSNNIRKMFQELREHKIISVLATAREFATIGDFLEQLNPDYFIGANGTFIWDVQNKEFVYKKTLIKDEVIQLYHLIQDDVRGFSITDFNKVYKSPNVNLNSWFIRPFKDNYHDFDEEVLGADDLYVITLNTDHPNEVSEKINKIIQENNFQMEVSAIWSKGIFIGPIAINKSNALSYLTNKLGLSLDNLIAFGDSENDYEMLKDAFYGVAMECAKQPIKEVAKDIALDCEYDGTYLKLKELEII